MTENLVLLGATSTFSFLYKQEVLSPKNVEKDDTDLDVLGALGHDFRRQAEVVHQHLPVRVHLRSAPPAHRPLVVPDNICQGKQGTIGIIREY
jgi:hypothetical protein